MLCALSHAFLTGEGLASRSCVMCAVKAKKDL